MSNNSEKSGQPIIIVAQVHKYFGHVHAVSGVSLEVQPAEVVVIVGPSGSGKSTLLRCINRLETTDAGHIIVDGMSLDDAKNINKVRAEVGMVFQLFNLFPHLTALENVTLAQRVVRKRSKEEAEAIAMEQLTKVGIPEKAHAFPGQLSGGQQQRVAIARALATRPDLILADEPTGELDTTTGRQIFALLRQVVEVEGITVLTATHDLLIDEYANLVYELQDGRIKAPGNCSPSRRFSR